MRFKVLPVFYEKVPLGLRDVVSDVRFSVYTMNEIWRLKFWIVCFEAVDEIWLFEQMEKLELRGQSGIYENL